MESIHIIVADKSQLVRLGITGILYQMGFSINIRDVNDPDRLIQALGKDNKGLLIISKSFLAICNNETIRQLQIFGRDYFIIKIEDFKYEGLNNLDYYEVIEPDDLERTIFHKIEKCLQKLSTSADVERPVEEISHREKDVLKLVALGMTNKEIADRLFISQHTVITHRKNITAKLGIKTIAGLTVYALLNKLISTEDIK